MQPRSNIKLASLIMAAFVFAMACICGPFLKPPPLPRLPTQPVKILHFENELVAFDYPSGMKVFSEGDSTFQYYPNIQLGGEIVAALGDPQLAGGGRYARSIRIFRQPMPSGSTLEAVKQEAYRKVESIYPRHKGVLDASGPITVAGLSAIQETYRVFSGEPAYEMWDIWVPKGNELYVISIWTEYTNPDDLAAFQKDAEAFLGNLQIK